MVTVGFPHPKRVRAWPAAHVLPPKEEDGSSSCPPPQPPNERRGPPHGLHHILVRRLVPPHRGHDRLPTWVKGVARALPQPPPSLWNLDIDPEEEVHAVATTIAPRSRGTHYTIFGGYAFSLQSMLRKVSPPHAPSYREMLRGQRRLHHHQHLLADACH